MLAEIIESYFDRLWPICRSITGEGLRQSFKILNEIIPLNLSEVPTGTKVLDWKVPKEWNVVDAFIEDEQGNRIIDFKESNLHLLNYSLPVNEYIDGVELQKHLYYRENLPSAIPYVTSYYSEKWGFCLSYEQYKKIDFSQKFKVFIDTTLNSGSLTYGDLVLKGKSSKEIVFSSYLCHPSMANNELSGPLTLAFLYQELSKRKSLNFSYRFILAPETIGSIVYLEKNGEQMLENVMAGHILTCCGDKEVLKIKRSRRGNSLADYITESVLANEISNLRIDEFDVDGSDERQYCSPGFNLPFISLYRSKYSEYPEYHTSLDNKELISFDSIIENVEVLLKMVERYEDLKFYESLSPYGEPQLGKRGLYEDLASKSSHSDGLILRKRVLSFCDGSKPIEQLIEKYGYDKELVEEELNILLKANLIRQVNHV